MELVKYHKANFEKNKLILDESLTMEEWRQLGQSLKQVEGSVQFWIGDWARFGDKKGFTGKYVNSKVYDILEDITGLDRETLRQYKSVADATSCTRVHDLDYSHHREVAKLPPMKQEFFLKKASEEKLSVKELREEIKLAEKQFEVQELPSGRFDIIYCDPPWQYDFSKTSSRKIENHYPTMTLEELCSLSLPDISKDCLLLMWTTAPKLKEALKVIESWGFEYKTHSVWDKQKIGMGYWFRGQHELLMVATKGNVNPPEPEFRLSSIYSEGRTNHSSKPVFYYDWIDKAFVGNKIELFARNKRLGWEAWGNEQLY